MDTDTHIKANNPEELLDLVNEQDEIIGEVVRKKANADPTLYHREIGIILLDNQNKVLLEKRSKYKKVSPGVWSIPAGHIEKGGVPVEVAHIELQEELGFDTELTFLEKKLRQYPHESHFMNYFFGKYTGQKITIEPAEVEATAFFDKADLEAAIASGEQINVNHFDMFEKVWSEFSSR